MRYHYKSNGCKFVLERKVDSAKAVEIVCQSAVHLFEHSIHAYLHATIYNIIYMCISTKYLLLINSTVNRSSTAVGWHSMDAT